MVAETFGPYEDSEIDSDKIAKYIALTEPKTIIEMLDKLEMLSEENEKLKNENLALPHLLEYNKELEEKLKMSSFL